MQWNTVINYIVIVHDIYMVKHIRDRIGFMYQVKIVEIVESYELFINPIHPYTKSLLFAIPVPDPQAERERQNDSHEEWDEDLSLTELREVKDGHWVSCTEEEYQQYKKGHIADYLLTT